MDMQTEVADTFDLKGYAAERIEQLELRDKATINIETQMAHAKALAQLISRLCETANHIDPEMIGWSGSLMGDILARLELAIEIESQQYSGITGGEA